MGFSLIGQGILRLTYHIKDFYKTPGVGTIEF